MMGGGPPEGAGGMLEPCSRSHTVSMILMISLAQRMGPMMSFEREARKRVVVDEQSSRQHFQTNHLTSWLATHSKTPP
jgi:hypothetical protein